MNYSGLKVQLLQIVTLWKYLSQQRKKQFTLLLILIISASLSEVVSIGLVLPFLGALTSPEYIYYHPFMQEFIQIIESIFGRNIITEPSKLIFPMTVIFVCVTIIAASIRILLVYAITRLSFLTGSDISIDMYRRTLYQEYSVHNSRNSSEVINSIITKSNTVTQGVINPILSVISSSIITVAIISTLFFIDKRVALISFFGFGSMYSIVIVFTRRQIRNNSNIVASQSTMMVKSLQEGLGGIRDVLISGSQKYYCDMYSKSDLMLRRASANNVFIGQAPRYAMEAIGIIVIVILAYIIVSQGDGLTKAIPILGALALGAQRLLPALQQAFNSYSTLKASQASFRDVLLLLEQKLPGYLNYPELNPMQFNKEIQLKDVDFYYISDKNMPVWVLKNVNLIIAKGSFVGFIGETGCGKSTLLDVIMGLLEPANGEFSVDGERVERKNIRNWQLNIAHVPQDIHLSDTSIEENIAFGIPNEEIDLQKVKKAAKQAQISEIIEKLPNKYRSLVGERGVKLSGGQRQRIGIARALYERPNVLILDEATSALDIDTESKVIESIKELRRDITILMISHRLVTLKYCDQIIKLDKNSLLFG
ncbi:MAG: ABC transporter ATP-binding protein [Candidatus Sedimenticola sp. (ex Thyasira tokunagai)]